MWEYKGEYLEEIPEGYVGMVYMITNIATNKKYIGKKIFHFTKTRQVKGKKKKSKVESDWQTYYGSNKELNEHVELFGINNFKREILYLCVNKSQMSYLELREQIDRRVLEKEEYYNEWISAKVRKTKHLTNL
jgi:hypothetical protein